MSLTRHPEERALARVSKGDDHQRGRASFEARFARTFGISASALIPEMTEIGRVHCIERVWHDVPLPKSRHWPRADLGLGLRCSEERSECSQLCGLCWLHSGAI